MPKNVAIVKVEEQEHTYDEVLEGIKDEEQNKIQDLEAIDTDFIIPPASSDQDIEVEFIPEVKIKKTRKPNTKKAKSSVAIPEEVVVVEPEIVVSSSEETVAPPDDTPPKNVKIVELSHCENCGTKLTARTLKYSHNNVCPANENKPAPKQKKKRIVKEIEQVNDIETPKPKPERVKRQEKINKLFESTPYEFLTVS